MHQRNCKQPFVEIAHFFGSMFASLLNSFTNFPKVQLELINAQCQKTLLKNTVSSIQLHVTLAKDLLKSFLPSKIRVFFSRMIINVNFSCL